jgi:hypothetical protein
MSEPENKAKNACPLCDWAFTALCCFALFGGLTYFGTPWYIALFVAHAQTVVWFTLKNRG